MMFTWIWLSEFGNSKWLLPAVGLLILIAVRSGTLPLRTALRWSSAIAVTAAVVLASKLAFMGWGIGSARLNFTGFSGHAALSAAIYPSLLVLLGSGRALSRSRLALCGLALAGLIAVSRLPLHAHSISEVVAGFALGCTATAFTLSSWTQPSRSLAILRWLAPAVLVIACLQFSTPNVSTHQLVINSAKYLSGRDQVYTRKWLRSRSVKKAQNLTQAVDTPEFSRQSLVGSSPLTDFKRFP